MKELLTATRMTTLLGCPRRHFWRYEIGLKAETEAQALRFGTAWHAAMEARWQGLPFEAALAAAVKDVKFEEVQLATLSGLLAGYYRRHEQDPVKELHAEVEFRHPIEGSRTFDSAGKIDGLGVLQDGRLVLMEHKTTSDSVDPASDYWLRLRLNQQVMQYVVAARALGWDVQVILYDVTKKPAIRQKQGETAAQFGDRLAQDTQDRADFYYARREVPVLDQDLEEFKIQRFELSKLILALRQAERRTGLREQAWPRNVNAMSCQGCEFSGFCLQGVHADAQCVPSGFRVGAVHGELGTVGSGQ
ncbi:MAG: PD-(D/E)XK nuclease family protein [bacterium]